MPELPLGGIILLDLLCQIDDTVVLLYMYSGRQEVDLPFQKYHQVSLLYQCPTMHQFIFVLNGFLGSPICITEFMVHYPHL